MRRPSPFGPKTADSAATTPVKAASTSAASSPTAAAARSPARSPTAAAGTAASPKQSLMPPIQGATVKRTSPRPVQDAGTPNGTGTSGLQQRGAGGGGRNGSARSSPFQSSGSSEWPPRGAPRQSNLLSPSTHASGAHTTPHRIHSSYSNHPATSQGFHLSPQHGHAAASPLSAIAVAPIAPSSARPTTGRSGLPSRPGTAAGGAATAPNTLAKPRTPFLPSFASKHTHQQQPQPLFPTSPLHIKTDSVSSDRSDSPTQAAALALLHGGARLTAAEMRSQNAMASPLVKPRSAQAPSKRQQLGSPQTNGRSFNLLDAPSPSQQPHNSLAHHNRSPSGALIPPASPMFVHAPSAEALKYDSLGLDGSPIAMHRSSPFGNGSGSSPMGSAAPVETRSLWPTAAAHPEMADGNSFSASNGSALPARASPTGSPSKKKKTSIFVPLSSRPAPSPSPPPAAATRAAAIFPSVESLLAALFRVPETDLAQLVPHTFLDQLRLASGDEDALHSRRGGGGGGGANSASRADANLLVYLSNLAVECADFAATLDEHHRPSVSDATLDRLVASVEAAHACSPAQREALGSFLDAHHVALGLDMAPTPMEVEALFADTLGGRFVVWALRDRMVARAASTAAAAAEPEDDSWADFVERTRQDVAAWCTTRAAEVAFLHAFLSTLRSGSATLILPPFSLEGDEAGATTKAHVSQLLDAVCTACGSGAPLAGLTLMATLRTLATEGAAFEDVAELQRHLGYVVEQQSALDPAQQSSLQQLLAIAPVQHDEFESFLARMQDLGFSLSLLMQLAAVVITSPTPSLATFERSVINAAVGYAVDEAATTRMLLQGFVADRNRPLLPSALTTEQVQSLLESMEAPRLLLCMERLTLRPAAGPGALYASFQALEADLKFLRCERLEPEIEWIDSALTNLGVPEADLDRTRTRLLELFDAAMHQSLGCMLAPPSSALRIFLSLSPALATLDASASAFLSTWVEARSMLYSLLASLPISSLASYLAPPPLLCSALALRTWHVDQLLCRAGGDGAAALRTIMSMQQARPRSLAGDWEAFAAAFSEAFAAAAAAPPSEEPQQSESFSPLQQMLRLFIQAPQNRLLPPEVSATISAAQLEELLSQLAAPITPPLPACISDSAPPPSYALVFHYLLQLSSLDFDTDAMCDDWASLLQVLHSARAETGHKEGQLLAHFSSESDCQLFLESARPSPRDLVRFSRTVGCGRMGMQVFRVLGFETQDTQKRAFALWAAFIAHARSKVAAEDGVEVRTSSDQPLASLAEEVAAAVAASLPPEEEAPAIFSFSMQVTPPAVDGVDAALLARLEPADDPRSPLLEALAQGRSALVVRSLESIKTAASVVPSASQMESLLTLASGSRTRLLTELSWLAANALSFDSLDSLLTHLAIAAFDPLRCAKAVNTAAHMLMAKDSVVLSSSLRRLELTTLQVEQLREYSWIPSELLRGHLARLERRRRHHASPPLDSLAELALELRAVHTAFLEVRACETKLVAAFLQSPFLSPAIFPPISDAADVARLLDAVQDIRALPLVLPRGCTEIEAAAGAGPSALATIVILQHLASREHEKRIRAAAAATATPGAPMAAIRAATHADLRELVLRCRSGTDLLNACNLHFRTLVDASSSSSSRLSDSELFAAGIEAAELLSYCWFWASSGKRFKSLRDLLRAAMELHELHAGSAVDLSKFALYTWLRAGSLLRKPTAISLTLTEELIIGLQPLLCEVAPSSSASKPSRAQSLQSVCGSLPLLLFFLQEIQSVVRSFALPPPTAAQEDADAAAAATAFAMRSSDGLGHLVQVTPGLLGLSADRDRLALGDLEALSHFLGNFLQSFRRGRYAAAFDGVRTSLPLLPPEAAWTQADWDALVIGSQGLLVSEMMQPMLAQLCAHVRPGSYLVQDASQLVALVSSLSRSFLRFQSAFLSGFKSARESGQGGVLARVVNLQGVRAGEMQLLQVFLASDLSPSSHLLVPHVASLPSSQQQLQGLDDFQALVRSTSVALASQRPPIAQWLHTHQRALIDPSMPSASAFDGGAAGAAADDSDAVSPSSPLAAHASAAYSRDFAAQVIVTSEALDALLLCEMAHPSPQSQQRRGLLERLQDLMAAGRRFPSARALCEAVQPQLQEAAFRKQQLQRVASSSSSSGSSTSSSAVAPASPPNGSAPVGSVHLHPEPSARMSTTSVEFVDFQVPSFGSGSGQGAAPTSSLGSWSAAHASSPSSPFRNVAAAVLREDSSRIAALHAHLASATCPLWLAASRVQMDSADSPLMEALVRAGRGVQKTAELVHAFERQALQFKDVETLTEAVEDAVREEMIAAGTMSARNSRKSAR